MVTVYGLSVHVIFCLRICPPLHLVHNLLLTAVHLRHLQHTQHY